MLADMIKNLLHRPIGAHADKVRGHQPAHTAFRIVEQLLRNRALLRREQRQELRDRGAGSSSSNAVPCRPATCRSECGPPLHHPSL